MTTDSTSSPPDLPLPCLSDEAAVEIYFFVENLFLLVDARYGNQIRRHFQALRQHDFIDPDFEPSLNDLPLDDPPF